MPTTRKLVIEAIGYFTYFALFYSIFASIVLLITGDPADLLRAGLMIVPGIVYFLLRRIATNLSILLLLHSILPIALGVILPSSMMTIVWVTICGVLALHSVIFAFSKPPTDAISFIIPCSMIFLFLSIWATRAGHGYFTIIYPTLLIIAVTGRILQVRMIKMDRSLEVIQSSYKQPIDKMIAFDYKLTAGLIIVITGMALVLYFLLIAPLTNAIGNANINLPEIEIESNVGSIPESAARPPISPFQDSEDLPERPPSLFWDLLTHILFGVVIIGLLALVIYGTYRFLMFLLSTRLYKGNYAANSSDIEDHREFIRPISSRRFQRIRSALAELHPTRRMFRDTAKKHIKMGIPIKKSDTPTDISKRIQSEDISNLVEEYAQVRYKE